MDAEKQEREQGFKALQEDLRREARKYNLLEIRDEAREGKDQSSQGAERVQEEKEEMKFRLDATDGVVWCPRCDSEMIVIHSSYYCQNCKYKAGCCG
jgi:transposase-like protein